MTTWRDVLAQTWSGCEGANVPLDARGRRAMCGNWSCCMTARVARSAVDAPAKAYNAGRIDVATACAECADDLLLNDGEESGTGFLLWNGSAWQPWQELQPATQRAFDAALGNAAVTSEEVFRAEHAGCVLTPTTDVYGLWCETHASLWCGGEPRPVTTYTVRPFVSSLAGDRDRLHGRPFMLGRPARYGKDHLRMWSVDVRMPDDPITGAWWCRGVLMIDEEVFNIRTEAAS